MRQRNQPMDLGSLARGLLSSGYTTSRLASELGVSQPTVSRLANGKQRLGADAAMRLIVLAGGVVQLPTVAIGEGVQQHAG